MTRFRRPPVSKWRRSSLANGFWNQNTANLPAFTAMTDFELLGGTFLRATGGTGSTANPYQLIGAYGLQGIGSPQRRAAELQLHPGK